MTPQKISSYLTYWTFILIHSSDLVTVSGQTPELYRGLTPGTPYLYLLATVCALYSHSITALIQLAQKRLGRITLLTFFVPNNVTIDISISTLT